MNLHIWYICIYVCIYVCVYIYCIVCTYRYTRTHHDFSIMYLSLYVYMYVYIYIIYIYTYINASYMGFMILVSNFASELQAPVVSLQLPLVEAPKAHAEASWGRPFFGGVL